MHVHAQSPRSFSHPATTATPCGATHTAGEFGNLLGRYVTAPQLKTALTTIGLNAEELFKRLIAADAP